MKIYNYEVYDNGVRVYLNDGTYKDLFFSQDSGKVYYRMKTNTISDVKHAGVYIGNDAWGIQYYVHNHYQLGSPHLATAADFTLGMPTYLYYDRCINPQGTVVTKALDHVIRQESFKLLSYNCQTVVNDSCNNQRTSEDATKWVGRAAAGLGLFLLLGAIFSNND